MMGSVSRMNQPIVRMSGHAFDPKTHYPQPNFSHSNIAPRLKKSILGEVSEQEATSRIELAAAYRVFAMKGWNDNIYNHLTARVHGPNGEDYFLINAFGLSYGETTASSLLTIDQEGNVINPGVVGDIFSINRAGFVIHSALHRGRSDAIAIMHSHAAPATGVAAHKGGLKELAQTTHVLGEKTYHDYQGVIVDIDEQEKLISDAGAANTVFLRNHGIITMGESIGAALYQMDQLILACEIQVRPTGCAAGITQGWAAANGADALLVPGEETVKKTFEKWRTSMSSSEYGIMEFCAIMRDLDRLDPSYRT